MTIPARRRVSAGPLLVAGVPSWRFEANGAHALFLGRGVPARGDALPRGLLPGDVAPAWLRQVHADGVREATAGACGEGDALVTDRPGIAATVATADCVPVLVASPGAVAAVHAGWRGIVAGVVAAALERLRDRGGLDRSVAWIGPSIGSCCYEVSEEVAGRVGEAAGADVRRAGTGGRPHLDLAAAVAAQLGAAGVEHIVSVDLCTRCRPEWLWSHRRDGEGCGRNLAMIWRDRS